MQRNPRGACNRGLDHGGARLCSNVEPGARRRGQASECVRAFGGGGRASQALGAYSEALAVSAASWGSPLVTMYCLRHNDAVGPHPKAGVNAIWRMEDISTPTLSQEAGYVTPNVNTL
jgi:hypothetical protein